LVLEVSLRLKF